MRLDLNKTYEACKWFVFVGLNKLADRHNRGQPALELRLSYPDQYAAKDPLIWVFCSTIGEVNACKPFLLEVQKQGRLVLITDRRCYEASYRRNFPNAVIAELSGRIDDGQTLLKALPPAKFIVCEIPASPVDAPCRLSYSVLRAARQAGAQCYLVNGWLYHYTPSCRMDQIEDRFFAGHYLNSFSFLTVQTETVRQHLLERGVDSARISVGGNMKFDSMADQSSQILDSRSVGVINELKAGGRRMVVAGCLTDTWEYELVANAFHQALKQDPALFLVMAPRHPEYPEQKVAISRILGALDLKYCYKSALAEGEGVAESAVLVLDTFGELKSFYGTASLCYVGLNHNVLEPLSFGKPVVVSPGWEETFPSYPVYQLTQELDLLEEAPSPEQLTTAMLREEADEAARTLIMAQLNRLSGAVDHSLEKVFA